MAEFFSVQVTFFDADGPTKTEEDYVSFLLPGQTTALGGPVFDIGRPDRMEVRIGSGDWAEIDFTAGSFAIDSVRTRDDRFGGHRTTGIIRSQFETRQENIEITAVYRNSAGEIVGAYSTYLDFLDADAEASFEISTFQTFDDLDSTEIYWQL